MLLDATLTNHSGALLEGRLQATVLRHGRKSSVHVSTELVIPPGAMKVQMLFPPPPDPAFGEGFAVELKFAGKDREIALGNHPLGRFPEGGEDFIRAIGRTSRRVSDLDRMRERSARLETLRPALETSAWFATANLSVAVEDLPTHPAGWCAYDVVLLDSAAFSALTARQLDSLARWIAAGGSAALFADGAIGERQHAFLQRLSGRHGSISLDAEQRLTPHVNQMLVADMGRVLLAPRAPATKEILDSPAWRAAIAWLWKVRPELVQEIEEHGVWPVQRPSVERSTSALHLDEWVQHTALEKERTASERPRLLPLSWVALLLATLLLLAGPAEWYVLGWLRRRRWTWLVFPTTCIAFAWLASRMATHYLGPQTRQSTIRVTDVGDGGRVLRDVAVRFRVPSSDEEWTNEITDGLSMATRAVIENAPGISEGADLIPDTRAEWLSPSRAILRQNTRQWTPHWQHSVSFAATVAPSPNWEALIARWKQAGPPTEQHLAAPASGFGVYYSPRHSNRHDAVPAHVFPADSLIDRFTASLFCNDYPPLPDILEAQSPVMVAGGMLGAGPRGPLIILAWQRSPEGVQVFRRHVSSREIGETP